MYFPDRGCVHTLLTLYVYATAAVVDDHYIMMIDPPKAEKTIYAKFVTDHAQPNHQVHRQLLRKLLKLFTTRNLS